MQVINKLIESKMMVRFNVWPSGTCNLAVYENEKQDKQYLYEGDNLAQLEERVLKDWSHLLGHVTPVSKLPLPPGFPRP